MFFKFGIKFRKNSTIYKGNKKIKCFKRIGLNVFNKARNLIYKYLLREYQTDLLGELNKDGYFSVDESLFGHCKEHQIWILGIINNTTKDFRLEGAYTRNSSTLEKFIKKICLGRLQYHYWQFWGYDFIDLTNFGYRRFKHIHEGGDFWLVIQSTSHIESIWNILKSKIKGLIILFQIKIL